MQHAQYILSLLEPRELEKILNSLYMSFFSRWTISKPYLEISYVLNLKTFVKKIMSTTHFNLSIGRSVDSGGNRKHFEEILSWTFISFGCFLLLLLTWEGAFNSKQAEFLFHIILCNRLWKFQK